MKKIFTILFLALVISGQVFTHSGKPKYHVIIDTDGAVDDMRALSMFLAGNDIRVLAITCSQGTLLPDSVFVKVRSLLSAFHHEGIRVGIGESTDFELPAWEPFARNIRWGNPIPARNPDFTIPSVNLLNRVLADYEEKITLIALGSLKTYADWLRSNPEIARKIERVIWYNNHDIKEGFNYRISPESFEFIKNCNIPLEIVANNSDDLLINESYLGMIGNANSVYARQISRVCWQAGAAGMTNRKHMHLWDDLVPLYLTVSILFETGTENGVKYVSVDNSIPADFIHEATGKLLISSTATNNRVFNAFPADTRLYLPAYAEILNATIENYGLEEWKAICLTNEVHGHTGIYSIIGAKTGIRAMEYFNVGVNNLKAITFAGNEPPLSCFNDGIQISTGATIGQGLITVSDSISKIPSAIFEFNHQKIHISLKPEIAERMQQEIRYGVRTHGNLTENYWRYIEDLAITYWSDFNRQDIFTIKEI